MPDELVPLQIGEAFASLLFALGNVCQMNSNRHS